MTRKDIKENSKWPDGYWGEQDKPPLISEERRVHSISVNTKKAGPPLEHRTPKWWGYELTYYNDKNTYCSKLLHFERDGHTSMHFHVDKHETLVVVSGILTLEYIHEKYKRVVRLGPGSAWVIPPGHPHRLIAAEGPVDIIESSTYDSDPDSIRIN